MRRITWRATRTPAWEPRAGYADRWKSNQMFQGTALFSSNYNSSHLSPFLKGLTFYPSSISYSAWLDSFTFFIFFFHFLHTFLFHYTKKVKSLFRWWTRSLAIIKRKQSFTPFLQANMYSSCTCIMKRKRSFIPFLHACTYLFNFLLKTDINRIQFWCNWSRSYDQAVITSSVCELQRGFRTKRWFSSGVLVMWAEVTQAVI